MLQHPIDFRTKINNYKSQFPLEYEKTVTDWDLDFRRDNSRFQIWCDKIKNRMFSYHFDSNNIFPPHRLEIFDGERVYVLRSKNGIYFSTNTNMFLYSKIWARPFHSENIKKLIGIKHIVEKINRNFDIFLEENLPRFKPSE